MCDVDWNVIADFTKIMFDLLAAAAWPAAVVGIAYTFRNAIRDALGRAKKLSGAGFSAELGSHQQESAQLADSGSKQIEAAGIAQIDPANDEVLGPIDEYFSSLAQQYDDPKQREKWLIRWVSFHALKWQFELTYRVIYGSQIQLLKYLNVFGPASLEGLEQFFNDSSAKDHVSSTYNFHNWITWLVNAKLIEAVPPLMSHYSLTPKGKRFLEWMVEASAPEVKAL